MVLLLGVSKNLRPRQAGVDMIVAWGSCQEHSKFVVEAVRRGAPNTLIGTGINPGAYDAWRQEKEKKKIIMYST